MILDSDEEMTDDQLIEGMMKMTAGSLAMEEKQLIFAQPNFITGWFFQ
jgi:hypothetical protein